MMGYEKIAFGEIHDPVRLLFCEDISLRALKRMNLFNIAEIKRPKGGGMEIKFFDRLKALQHMQEMDAEKDNTGGFFKALEEGARILEEGGER